MKFESRYFKSWTEFFVNHENIAKLSLETQHYEPIGQQLVEIINELNDLVELKAEYFDDTCIDVITSIIQRHDKLMRFEVKKGGELDMARLHELFDNEWHLTGNEAYGTIVLFERKKKCEEA